MEPQAQAEQALTESQSSIEVTRGVKGEYGWKIKKYAGSPLPDLSGIVQTDIHLKHLYTAATADNLAEELERSVAAIKREMDGGAA